MTDVIQAPFLSQKFTTALVCDIELRNSVSCNSVSCNVKTCGFQVLVSAFQLKAAHGHLRPLAGDQTGKSLVKSRLTAGGEDQEKKKQQPKSIWGRSATSYM